MIQMERKGQNRCRSITILCHGGDWVLEGKYSVREGHEGYDHINHSVKLKPPGFGAHSAKKREIDSPDKQQIHHHNAYL